MLGMESVRPEFPQIERGTCGHAGHPYPRDTIGPQDYTNMAGAYNFVP